MDAGYLQLIQIILLIFMLWGMCRFALPLIRHRFVPVLVTEGMVRHPVYGHFRRQLLKRDLDAYDKYQIWRYIEKRKIFL